MKIKKLLKKSISKRIVVVCTLITFLLCGLGLTSYSVFFENNETAEETLEFGDLALEFSNGDNTLTRMGDYPLSDNDGMYSTEPYVFSITNTGDLIEKYTVKLDDDLNYLSTNGITQGSDSYLKISIDDKAQVLSSTITGTNIVEGIIEPGERIVHKIKLWISDNAPNDLQEKGYAKKITAKGEYIPDLKKEIAPENCFSMLGGEITGYNYSSSACPTEVIIPDYINGTKVTSIGYAAFSQMPINRVILPQYLENIASYAFRGTKIVAIDIPDSVTTIGTSAFASTYISDVIFGSSLQSIDVQAFQSCELTSVVFPDSLNLIGEAAFLNNYLTNVVTSNNISAIDSGAFTVNATSNKNLKKITNKGQYYGDWSDILGAGRGYEFDQGFVPTELGEVEIVLN